MSIEPKGRFDDADGLPAKDITLHTAAIKGSVIDFAAFFIAEALISLSPICTVVVGYRVELRKKAEAAAA